MLTHSFIEFIIGNFASFRNPVTLSLVAAKIRSKNKKLDTENVIPVDAELNLLTSVALCGPNASGKSNLVAAANLIRHWVLHSFKDTRFDEGIPVERLRLNTETEDPLWPARSSIRCPTGVCCGSTKWKRACIPT